jgi:hypothetical protein
LALKSALPSWAFTAKLKHTLNRKNKALRLKLDIGLGNVICSSMVLVRKKILERVQKYDTSVTNTHSVLNFFAIF